MKKVIKGKVYDTEKAQFVGEYTDKKTGVNEKLYRKKTGEFFLHGMGGKDTIYRRFSKKTGKWEAGEELVPLTFAEARTFTKDHLPAEMYKKYFAKDRGVVPLATSVSPAAKDRLNEIASHLGVSQRTVLDTVLEHLTLPIYEELCQQPVLDIDVQVDD